MFRTFMEYAMLIGYVVHHMEFKNVKISSIMSDNFSVKISNHLE